MKTYKYIQHLLFSLCYLVLVLSACFAPLDYTGRGNGTLGISFNDGTHSPISRNVINKEDLRYELRFHGPGGRTITRNAVWGEVVYVDVVPGSWLVHVRAYLDGELHAEGSEPVEVKTGQENFVEVKLNWTMNVVEININSPPDKIVYHIGEPLNLYGLQVQATYNDGSSGLVTITLVHLSGYDPLTSGTQTLTVTYGGKSDTFTVTVDNVQLTGITITNQPTKTSYFVGETLDIAGLVVEAQYNNSTTAPIDNSLLTFSGFNFSAPGTSTVTVSYGSQITTFTVIVENPPPPSGTVSIDSNSTGFNKYHQSATLTANTASVTGAIGSPTSYTWRRGSTVISGATGVTYTLGVNDRNQNISVTVNYSNGSLTSSAVQVHPGTAISNLNTITRTGDYILTSNIDSFTTPKYFGTSDYFEGTLDGNGHTITLAITTMPALNRGGLFSGLDEGAVVKNLRLTGTISIPPSGGASYVGAVAGENKGTIENVSSRVNITVNDNNYYMYGGGIAGNNNGNSAIIQNCYSTGNVTLNGRFTLRAGGIAGNQENNAKVLNSWASGNISTSGSANQQSVGGIIGVVQDGSISRCVALNETISGTATSSGMERGRIAAYVAPALTLDNTNYANNALPSASTSDGFDGTPVALTDTQATNGTWWSGTVNVNWSAVWGAAAANEEHPWKWSGGINPRPILFFETEVNRD